MVLEKHNDVMVLRDDLLPGGTKSVFLDKIVDPVKHFIVYASPVYGGMQIALAAYCNKIGKRAVIFCAKRNKPHGNSLRAKEAGAIVYQVPFGYLSHCQKTAQDFSEKYNGQLIKFGADYPEAIGAIAERMQQVIKQLGREPEEIFCASGSGTLLKGIIKGTTTARITAVQVGAEITIAPNPRVTIVKYHKPFEYESTFKAPFASCANYDLKAWEMCIKLKTSDNVLFWNVL